jgi:hypothetical protein
MRRLRRCAPCKVSIDHGTTSGAGTSTPSTMLVVATSAHLMRLERHVCQGLSPSPSCRGQLVCCDAVRPGEALCACIYRTISTLLSTQPLPGGSMLSSSLPPYHCARYRWASPAFRGASGAHRSRGTPALRSSPRVRGARLSAARRQRRPLEAQNVSPANVCAVAAPNLM